MGSLLYMQLEIYQKLIHDFIFAGYDKINNLVASNCSSIAFKHHRYKLLML